MAEGDVVLSEEGTVSDERRSLSEIEVPLEDFHDSYWTARKLWVLGSITLGSALVVIYLLASTAAPV